MFIRSRRILSVLLLLATVAALSFSAAAGGTTGFLNSETYLRTSYNEDNYLELSLSGSTLTVSGKLRLEGLSGVMVVCVRSQICKAENGKPFTLQVPLSHSGTAPVSISTVRSAKPGIWTLSWDRIIIEKAGSGYRFMPSLALDHNLVFVYAAVNPEWHLNPQSVPASVKTLSDRIVAGVTDDYEKTFLLHKWVVENIYYDFDAFLSGQFSFYEPEDILANKRAVCEGYAELLCSMLRSQGIPAIRSITNALGYGMMGTYALNAEEAAKYTANHSHVEAWVDGRWVVMDPTWDSCNKYQNGAYNTELPDGFFYFDITPEVFALDHKYYDRYRVRYSEGVLIGEESPDTFRISRSSQKLNVGGVERSAEVYNINGSNYFKLRDIAVLLSGTGSQFGVSYDSAHKTISVTTGMPYFPTGGELAAGQDNSSAAVRSAQQLFINGRPYKLIAYNIGGNNFFKLRDLGAALGFHVGYDSATATMLVRSRT